MSIKNKYAPLISIIVACYNKSIFLKQALNSLIHQSLSNIEIILVDDCSSDNSRAIMEAFSVIDKRIKLLSFPVNKGTHSVRRAGVLAAGGKYVMFLDADDYYQLDACEKAYELMERGYDIGIFNVTPINTGNASPALMQHCEWYNRLPPGEYTRDIIMSEAFGKGGRLPCFMPSKIFTIELAQLAYKEMEEARHIFFEDMYEFLYLSFFARKIAKSESSIYNYSIGTGISTLEDWRFTKSYIANKTSIIGPFTDFCINHKLFTIARSARNEICRWTLEAVPWIVKGAGLQFMIELAQVYGVSDVIGILYEEYRNDIGTLVDLLPDAPLSSNVSGASLGYCVSQIDIENGGTLIDAYKDIFNDNQSVYLLGSSDNEIFLAQRKIYPVVQLGNEDSKNMEHFRNLYEHIVSLNLKSIILTDTNPSNLCLDLIFLSIMGINTILFIDDLRILSNNIKQINIFNINKFLKKFNCIYCSRKWDASTISIIGIDNIRYHNKDTSCSNIEQGLIYQRKSKRQMIRHLTINQE